MKKSQKQEKSAFIEAHTATKGVWVMVLFIFLTLFLFGSVSAAEWDNVKSYDEGTKTIRIENAFGLPLIGDTIAEIRLETPIKNRVGLGYQKVAEMQFIAYDDFKRWFSTMELYDVRNEMSSIERDLDFKYDARKNVSVDKYGDDCKKSVNGTFYCERVLVSSYLKEVEDWKDINEYVFVSGDIINIGIFTDVKVGDKIEWIPTFYGKRITEWAEWTADLNTNIVGYWKFDNNNLSDSVQNLITTNTGTTNGTGIIISGRDFVATSSQKIDITDHADLNFGTGAFSLNVWIKHTDVNNAAGIITKHRESAPWTGWTMRFAGNSINLVIGGTGIITGTTATHDNAWHMITWTRQSNGTNTLYIDAVSEGTPVTNTADLDFAIDMRFGQVAGFGEFYNGDMDEAGVWKGRALTQSEITHLYNGGSGITFSGDFPLTFSDMFPGNTSFFNNSNISFWVNVSDLSSQGVKNVSLLINGSIAETNTSGVTGNYTFNNINLIEGENNWSVRAFDNSSSQSDSDTLIFAIDLTSPSLNITLPLNTTYTDNYSISPTINISLNWTVSDTNLDSCWYYNTTANVSITCGNNATIILPYGGYTFIVYANDSVGHESSSNVTATWGYKLLQNSITFNEEAFELSNEEFKINVSSTGEQTVTSNIVYNGTSYLANKAGDNILMEFSRTIPIYTAGNNSFYWSFGYGSEIINSSTYFQNISETNLANCTSGTKYFNLLLKDEKTMEFLNSSNNISIETVFLYYINDISVNKTFVSSFNQNNVSFCLDPPIENVKVFGEISYDNDLHVKERHFILFENFTNSTTINITLYDLAASESTSFLVFTETEGAPYPNVYMKLKRQYLNLNDFVVVEMAKADSFGQTILHFVTEDEIYKIDFYDEDGNLVLTTEPFQAVCIDNVCSMSFKVDPEGGIIPPFQGISPDGNLVFTLSLVGNDTAVLLNYVSTNGSAYNLQMKTAGFSIVNDTVLVCTETQTNTISGSMSCNISSYPFTTYVTELWVDDVLNDIQYSSVTNDAWKDFGNEGIIYTILIIMALTLLLIYTPELCVLGSIAGVLISAKFGFIPMTYVSGMYLVVAGIIIIFKMRKN